MYDQQFYNTSNRLIRDVSKALGRELEPTWVGGFCLPMIGSLGQECGGFHLMEEGKPTVAKSLGGISFAQWTGMGANGRRARFMAYCREQKLHPYSYDAAVGFIVVELTTTAASIPAAVLAVTTPASTPEGGDRVLMARVMRFERLYENAGVPNYPSRYQWAIKAGAAFAAWAQAGYPELGKYVMPKARFSDAFDKEFGPGLSDTTARADGLIADETDTIAPGTISTPRKPIVVLATPGKAVPGRWPEDALAPKEIEAIQRRLRDLGYVSVGTVDGRWGKRTEAAILILQKLAGIEVDGHWGPQTRKAMIDGVRNVVAPERANATARQLFDAGEPFLQAVHPASLLSKVVSTVSGVATIAYGISAVWPQASSTIDSLRVYANGLPGYVYLIATFLVALYLYFTTKNVKQVAVDTYRTGANTALANPIAGVTTVLNSVFNLPSAEEQQGGLLTAGTADDPEAGKGATITPETIQAAAGSDPTRAIVEAASTAASVISGLGETWAQIQRLGRK